MKTAFKVLKLSPAIASLAMTACGASHIQKETPAPSASFESADPSQNATWQLQRPPQKLSLKDIEARSKFHLSTFTPHLALSEDFMPELFPKEIESEQALETLAENTFSFGLKILQNIKTPLYELFIAEGSIGSGIVREYIAVYMKQQSGTFILVYESAMPPMGKQDASFVEAKTTFKTPMENYIDFERAEIQEGFLNIYFNHLTIEAPFGSNDEYFRYLEERLWKKVALPIILQPFSFSPVTNTTHYF